MSALTDALLEIVQKEFHHPAPIWNEGPLSQDDFLFLNKECSKPSEFDPHNKRSSMVSKLVKGEVPAITTHCEYGQVVAICEEPKQMRDIPWSLWGRIFRIFSEKKPNKAIPFKVFFLANTNLRIFPPGRGTIGPENINGGYTYPCNRETIVIYRAEDATRVLIHELNHACCLDNPNAKIDELEAETEAWAELIYIGLLSEGDKILFNKLLRKQSAWIVKQNREVRKHIHSGNSKEFPWRYTIGKEDVWLRWGILDGNTSIVELGNSLRLTVPPSNDIKKKFGVSVASNIL